KSITPEFVLTLSHEMLRKTGMSHAKANYIADLAGKVVNKELHLTLLNDLPDEEVIEELTKIKGIGRWTAEMFLMFTLGREDVFSHGDLGLRNGFERVYGKRSSWTRNDIEKITARWSPYRSYGSLALWHAMDSVKEAKKKA